MPGWTWQLRQIHAFILKSEEQEINKQAELYIYTQVHNTWRLEQCSQYLQLPTSRMVWGSSPGGGKIFHTYSLRPTQPHVLWVLGLFPRGKVAEAR
jgi:hypothetical protein